jgi:hypothetical protein
MIHVKNGRPIEPILFTAQEKPELKRRTSAPTVAKKDSERAEIILLRAQGMKQEEVASQLQFREGGKVNLALSSPRTRRASGSNQCCNEIFKNWLMPVFIAIHDSYLELNLLKPYRTTRPEALPPMSFSTSARLLKLKSPSMEWARLEAATAKRMALDGSARSPVFRA